MKYLACLLSFLVLSTNVFGVQLDTNSADAVRLDRSPVWNAKVIEASDTSYKLTSKAGTQLSGSNYGYVGIGNDALKATSDLSLTQGACNTLWGSATNLDVALYAAYGNAQATSTSNSTPSTDISGGSDNALKIAVDKNPAVTASVTVTGLNSGALIAAAFQTSINNALAAAEQGARVDVEYASSLYKITSRLKGARSSVVVTAAGANNVADNLKLGVANSGVEVAGAKGLQLCVSDVAGKTTAGSAAIGASGYLSCPSAVPAATAVRQIAYADLNCSGPVIGTVKELPSVIQAVTLPVKKFGSATSATTAAALVFAIRGLEAGDKCVATPVSLGTGPNYIKSSAVTANTLTVTFDTAQSSGSTVINYVCY